MSWRAHCISCHSVTHSVASPHNTIISFCIHHSSSLFPSGGLPTLPISSSSFRIKSRRRTSALQIVWSLSAIVSDNLEKSPTPSQIYGIIALFVTPPSSLWSRTLSRQDLESAIYSCQDELPRHSVVPADKSLPWCDAWLAHCSRETTYCHGSRIRGLGCLRSACHNTLAYTSA
jgi:hypothetical protein